MGRDVMCCVTTWGTGWKLRGVLAAQNDDFDRAHVLEKSVVGIFYLVSGDYLR